MSVIGGGDAAIGGEGVTEFVAESVVGVTDVLRAGPFFGAIITVSLSLLLDM
jgi:hypothetical protein